MLIGGKEHSLVKQIYVPDDYDSTQVQEEALTQAKKAIEAIQNHGKGNKKVSLFDAEENQLDLTIATKKPRVRGNVVFATM